MQCRHKYKTTFKAGNCWFKTYPGYYFWEDSIDRILEEKQMENKKDKIDIVLLDTKINMKQNFFHFNNKQRNRELPTQFFFKLLNRKNLYKY